MAIIGIDLGLSNSAAAVMRGGSPVMIPSAEGSGRCGAAFPSCVALTPDGRVIAGELARRQLAMNSAGTTVAFKRGLGQGAPVRLGRRDFTPEELSAFLLAKIKCDAEVFVSGPVNRAVITVPAAFDGLQRHATRTAARMAGFTSVRLLDEPVAACLAHQLDVSGRDLRIAVVDIGCEALDVAILEIHGGLFAVRSSGAAPGIGGIAMNQAVVAFLAERFKDESGVDVRADAFARARLAAAAETAMWDLSTASVAQVRLPFLTAVRGEPRHFERSLSRAAFERAVQPVLDRGARPVEEALHEAAMAAENIDALVLVGGPARLACVRTYFERVLHRDAETGPDPMQVVALGAAIHAQRWEQGKEEERSVPGVRRDRHRGSAAGEVYSHEPQRGHSNAPAPAARPVQEVLDVPSPRERSSHAKEKTEVPELTSR